MQQVGSALGLATLVTLALRYAGDQIRHGISPAVAQTHGYALSFRIGAAVLAVAAVLALLMLEHVAAKPRTAVAEVPAAPSTVPQLCRTDQASASVISTCSA